MTTVRDAGVAARLDFLRGIEIDDEDREERRYTHMNDMTLEQLLHAGPPRALYETPTADAAADVDAVAAAVAGGQYVLLPDAAAAAGVGGIGPDAKRRARFQSQCTNVNVRNRRAMVSRYADRLYEALMRVWGRPATGWPGRQALLGCCAAIGAYCTANAAWLNQYVKSTEAPGLSALLSLQCVRQRLLCAEHGLAGAHGASSPTGAPSWGGGEGGGGGGGGPFGDEQHYRATVGGVRFSDWSSLCALELVADRRRLCEQSASDVYRFVHRATVRLPTMALRDDGVIDDLLRAFDAVELWMARAHATTHSTTAHIVMACPARRRALWFKKIKVGAAPAGAAVQWRYVMTVEYVADVALMLYEMRRQLLMHRTLCFPRVPLAIGGGGGGGAPQSLLSIVDADEIAYVAGLPCAYDAGVVDALVRVVCGKRSDPRTFLEQAHAFMLERAAYVGEMERYQRAHNGHMARRPGDLLHYVRGAYQSAYLMNKAAEPTLASIWDEETSTAARELFLHEMLMNDHRSRLQTYNWRDNVLYAPAMRTAGQHASERFIAELSARRTQPFIVESVGCYLLVHRRRCYRTVRFGEATAMWFWLVDTDHVPPELRRLMLAYRAFLWHRDATPMNDIDRPEATTAPPDGAAFVVVTQ